MSKFKGISDEELAEKLIFALRQKRVTEERSCRLIAKRRVWRQENGYRPDEMIEENYAEQQDSIVQEKAAFYELLEKIKDPNEKARFRQWWFGRPMQPYEQ